MVEAASRAQANDSGEAADAIALSWQLHPMCLGCRFMSHCIKFEVLQTNEGRGARLARNICYNNARPPPCKVNRDSVYGRYGEGGATMTMSNCTNLPRRRKVRLITSAILMPCRKGQAESAP